MRSAKKDVKNAVDLRTLNEKLSSTYEKKLKPLEQLFSFSDFHSPTLDNGDFTSKPMVLLLGQYSTGKTTFIRHLIRHDYPGMNIGPEPTTDQFCIIMNGDDAKIPGNVLVADSNLPFRPLAQFGNHFLNRLQCCKTQSPVLDAVTFIDTPGILSGEKQRIARGYDYTKVIKWFAEHVDRIILLFDAHKLDISDEFKSCIEALREYDEKIRIVLNKADMVDAQQLMRIYGALMWGLGKVLGTPEVCRVYIGSFWDKPLRFNEHAHLFNLETQDLFSDLQSLPSTSIVRKFNDIIRRARLAKVHAYILSYLKGQMPSLMGKEKKKQDLINDLTSIFELLARQHQISIHDFPKVDHMRSILNDRNFSAFPMLKPKMLDTVEALLSQDIPELLKLVPKDQEKAVFENRDRVVGGVFHTENDANVFTVDAMRGINRGRSEPGWVVDQFKPEYEPIFNELNPQNGCLSGGVLRTHFKESRLPLTVLRNVWKLSDIGSQGFLDLDEFCLAKYLIKLANENEDLPEVLPPHLIPPSKRDKPPPSQLPIAVELNEGDVDGDGSVHSFENTSGRSG